LKIKFVFIIFKENFEKSGGKYKITGSSYSNINIFDGRPIPTELEIPNQVIYFLYY
jgi:hypothetical protein